MTICKPFRGPVTATALTQWLVSCEDAFEEASFERGKDVPDKLKITYAGDAIAAETGTLYEWWTGEHDELKTRTWETFVEEMKSWVLGVDWKMGALEHFYRIEQGDSTTEHYISELRAARLVVEKSKVAAINDSQFKCHLLFRATPTLAALVQSTPGFNFGGATVTQLETAMRAAGGHGEYDGHDDHKDRKGKGFAPSSIPTETPPPYSQGSSSWKLSEQWGDDDADGLPFSDLKYLPPNPTGLCRVISMGVSADTWVRGLKTTMRADDTRATWVPESHIGGTYPAFRELALEAGEYINCAMFTRYSDHDFYSVRLETNRGRSLQAGSAPTDDGHVFRAARGQRIVGFYGKYKSNNNYIRRVGVIYAPVLPGETEV